MFKSRRRASQHVPPGISNASSSAAVAATQAFLKNQQSNASLSSAAAAAALRTHTPTPSDPGSIQTKRMVRRGSTSSQGDGPNRAESPARPGLSRTNSNGSMSERSFRSPSPNRANTARVRADPDAPPVPALPRTYTPTLGGHKRASSVEPITKRMQSPTPRGPGARYSSVDTSNRMPLQRMSSPPPPDATSPTNKRSSVNFSRPMSPTRALSPTPSSPTASPMSKQGRSGWHTAPIGTATRGGMEASRAQGIVNATPAAKMVYDPASRTMRPASEMPPPVPVPIPEPGPQVTAARAAAPTAPGADRSSAFPSRPRGILTKQPSIVQERREEEEEAEALMASPSQTPKMAVTLSQSSHPTTVRPRAQGHVRTASLEASSVASTDRTSSMSPPRQAHFATGPVSFLQNGLRHEPPPRSLSPAKPALKQSPSPASSIRTSSPAAKLIQSSPAKGHRSDVSVSGSEDGKRTPSKKKGNRVSFDAAAEIIPAAKAPEVASPAAQAATRPVFDDENFEMEPRPVLPSFGSVRGRQQQPPTRNADMAPSAAKVSPARPAIAAAAALPTAAPAAVGTTAPAPVSTAITAPTPAAVPKADLIPATAPTQHSGLESSSDLNLGGILADDLAARQAFLTNDTGTSTPLSFEETGATLPPEVTALEGSGLVTGDADAAKSKSEETSAATTAEVGPATAAEEGVMIPSASAQALTETERTLPEQHTSVAEASSVPPVVASQTEPDVPDIAIQPASPDVTKEAAGEDFQLKMPGGSTDIWDESSPSPPKPAAVTPVQPDPVTTDVELEQRQSEAVPAESLPAASEPAAVTPKSEPVTSAPVAVSTDSTVQSQVDASEGVPSVVEPADGAAPEVTKPARTRMAHAVRDESDDGSLYDDAEEELSDQENFASLNAIAVSPIKETPNKAMPQAFANPPQEQTVEPEPKTTDWNESKAYWSKLSEQRRQELERQARPKVYQKDTADKTVPEQRAMPAAAAASAPVAADAAIQSIPPPSGKPQLKSALKPALKPALKNSNRQTSPPVKDEPKRDGEVRLRRTMRGSSEPPRPIEPDTHHMRQSMRSGPTHTRAASGSGTQSSRYASPPPSVYRGASPSSSLRQRPMSVSGFSPMAARDTPPRASAMPGLFRRDSDASDSSFKRSRGPDSIMSDGSRYTMRSTMRKKEPGPRGGWGSLRSTRRQSPVRPVTTDSSGGKRRFSLRSLSPTGSLLGGRRRMRNSIDETSNARTSMHARAESWNARSPTGHRQLRQDYNDYHGNGIAKAISPVPQPTMKPRPERRNSSGFQSRFEDSDDEDSPVTRRHHFRSRFADSDDESIDLTPVRGIPRRTGEEDGESTDLEEESTPAPAIAPKAPTKQTAPAGAEGMLLASGSMRKPNAGLGESKQAPTSNDLAPPVTTPKKEKRSFFSFRSPKRSSSVPAKGRQIDTDAPPVPAIPKVADKPPQLLAPGAPGSKLPRSNAPQTPLKQTDGPEWPLTPSTMDPGDKLAAAGANTTTATTMMTRPDVGQRRNTVDGLSTRTTRFDEDNVVQTGGGEGRHLARGFSQRTGKKKKFPMLRKAFGLDD